MNYISFPAVGVREFSFSAVGVTGLLQTQAQVKSQSNVHQCTIPFKQRHAEMNRIVFFFCCV